MLPNEIFNMDLSAGEIALYAFLMRMEDRKTFTCYPAFKTIGNALHMSYRGAPRRVTSKRKPDVQDSTDQASGGFFPQAATIQLRQKKKALVARKPKKAKKRR